MCMLSCSVVSDSLRPHGPARARQDPVSVGFSRQEYSSGLPAGGVGSIPGLGRSPGGGSLVLEKN